MATLDSFQKRLKCALEQRMWTQRELAKYCKIQEGLISKYLSGVHYPSKKTLIMICAGLDISPEWLKNNSGSSKDNFDIGKYSILDVPRIALEKSTLNGYDLTINITETELKKILSDAIK